MPVKLKMTIAIAIIALVAAGGWLMLRRYSQPNTCPSDAKVCPDNSSVLRTGPNCEFAACPETKLLKITIYCTNNNCQPEDIAAGAGTLIRGCFRSLDECAIALSACSLTGDCIASSSLKTKTDKEQSIEYQYLEKLPTTYIQTQDWPPKVTVVAGEFICRGEPASTSSPAVTAVQRTIGSQAVCVKQAVGAAAGSVYTDYAYSTIKDGKLATVEFTLQAPQCANYVVPQQTACEQERQAFNPDGLVVPIFDSLKITQAGSDAINIENLQTGQVISSPLAIKGQALGKWYFEAVFPVILRDASGKEIARTQARAASDWAVSGFVPFEAALSFKTPATATGTLVFQNDNPSGLPANQETFELPVRFVK